jgi:predicted protein tyrosine phosphatase
MKYVTFIPKAVAEEIQPNPLDSTFLISIQDPLENTKIEHWKHDVLVFHDVDEYRDGFIPFDSLYAQKIIDAVERGYDSIYVHCTMGVSRSAAVAKWIADRYDDYELWFHPYGHHTLEMHNRFVYNTLEKTAGTGLVGYYNSLEEKDEE